MIYTIKSDSLIVLFFKAHREIVRHSQNLIYGEAGKVKKRGVLDTINQAARLIRRKDKINQV